MDEILIDGFIVNDMDEWIYRWFGIAVTSPNGIRAALKKANGAPVTVRINSPGGETWSASVIYTDLREYAGEVTVKVVGLAASAASVIAMAGDKVLMSPTAEMMIHNPWMYAEGDHREMDHAADVLRTSRETIINAYALRAKSLTRAEIGNMLNKETWFDAQKALGCGLIDAMMFDDGDEPVPQPEPSGGSEPMPGGKAAAANVPSAAALKERKRVWDELAPGAASLDDAKARIAAATAPPVPIEPEPAPEPEPPVPDDSEITLLRAQIDILAQY